MQRGRWSLAQRATEADTAGADDEAGNEPGCNDNHNLVVFSTPPDSHRSNFWIAGEDPPGCGDGDCNLTVMKVSPDEE